MQLKIYFRLLSYATPFWSKAIPYAIFTVLSVVFGLVNFTLLKPLLDVLFSNPALTETQTFSAPTYELTLGNSVSYLLDWFNYYLYNQTQTQGKYEALKFVCWVLISSVFFSNVFKYLSTAIVESLRITTVQNIRNAAFQKVVNMPLSFISNERKGDLIARLTVDVNEVEHSVTNTMVEIFKGPVTLIASIIWLFTISVKLTLFSFVMIPVSGIIIGYIVKQLRRTAIDSQQQQGQLISTLDETLGGMRVVMAFNAIDYVVEKFKVQNTRLANLIISIIKKKELASPVSEFMGSLVVVMILLYGGNLVLSNSPELDTSSFITYVVVFSQVMRPAKALLTTFGNIQRGLAAGTRVLEIVDREPEIKDAPTAMEKAKLVEGLEFRNVTFSYGEREVLKNVSFKIPKGKTVALVGPSGSGKSTIADLIPRFYDIKEGEILIDGVNIKTIKLNSLRGLMGVVTQESVLFNDTIFNNISFGKANASLSEVENAAKAANAHNFILETENGYQTPIGDRGGKLSGGQRQRLAIARAIFANSEIMILDEATSALDTESERLVQEALTNLLTGRTSLIIAHRLSTITHADEIIVLNEGEIVERGTHQELVSNGGLYARLSSMQQIT